MSYATLNYLAIASCQERARIEGRDSSKSPLQHIFGCVMYFIAQLHLFAAGSRPIPLFSEQGSSATALPALQVLLAFVHGQEYKRALLPRIILHRCQLCIIALSLTMPAASYSPWLTSTNTVRSASMARCAHYNECTSQSAIGSMQDWFERQPCPATALHHKVLLQDRHPMLNLCPRLHRAANLHYI